MTSTSEPTAASLYHMMRRIRTFEERVGELFVRGGSAGSMLHLSIGEEAVAAICALMHDADTFTTHHRGHGIFLARGADPRRMMAEIAGKATGYCNGKGGSMHIAASELGSLGANAIVGGGIPHSIGAAYSYKLKDQSRLAVAFFGDGAMQQGLLYECMNLAALWQLPMVFVCVNNQYGMGTHISQASATLDFCERARTFGLAANEADGGDVITTLAQARPLLDGARQQGQPALLVLNCYRFFGHARMDKSPYRDEEEETKGRKCDPVTAARQHLAQELDAAELDAMDANISAEMDEAVDFALAAANPAATEMFTGVYGPDQPAPQPVRARIAQALAKHHSDD